MDEIQKMEAHQLTIQNFGEVLVHKFKDDKQVKTAMAMICGQIARISGKEIPPVDVKYIVDEIFTEYSHTPLAVHLEAFKMLAKSKTYGKITLNDLMECHVELATDIAIDLEREHEKRKGFGSQEIR